MAGTFSRAINAVGFWALCGLALVLFVLAVLVPLRRDCRELLATERQLAGAVADLEEQVELNRTRIEQLRARDPLLAERIARERLNYVMPGGREVRVGPVQAPASAGEGPDDPLAAPPATQPLDRLLDDLPDRLDDPLTLRAVLIAAAASIVLAFVLFGRRPAATRRP